jgi:hypothetical protein
VRFLTVALLADFALFIPFFLRAGAPRFAFLDFFATFNLPIFREICQHGIKCDRREREQCGGIGPRLHSRLLRRPSSHYWEVGEVQATARSFGIEVATPEIRRAEDIGPAFEELKGRAEAFM